MTSDLPYRAALPFEVAREEIRRGSDRQFDSRAASVFLSVPDKSWRSLREESSTNRSYKEPNSLGSPRRSVVVVPTKRTR